MVARISIGEVEDTENESSKDSAAVSLGRRGGLKGGKTLNMSEVASILRTGDFKKNEFETTGEFSKRSQQRLASVQNLISKTGNAEMIFLVQLKDSTYNADQRTMTIGSEFSGVFDRNFSDGSILIFSSSQDNGSYEGVNAFGVKKIITKRDVRELRVTIPKNETTSYQGSKAIWIFMSPEEAAFWLSRTAGLGPAASSNRSPRHGQPWPRTKGYLREFVWALAAWSLSAGE